MATPKAQISLEPAKELVFKNVEKVSAQAVLVISNQSDVDTVHFKVKTTAPKRYCVRPTQGKIAPKSSCDVMLILQQLKAIDAHPERPDKFLVQALTAAPDVDTRHLFQMTSPKEMAEAKLSCVFVNDDDGAPANEKDEGKAQTDAVTGEDDTPLAVLKRENTRLASENNKAKSQLLEARRGASQPTDTNRQTQSAPKALTSNSEFILFFFVALIVGLLVGYYY